MVRANSVGRRPRTRKQRGQTLVIFAAGVVMLIGFVGLAIDAGRAYVLSAQLSKAVDAAALAGAKARGRKEEVEAVVNRVFKINFPLNYMGVQEFPILKVEVDLNAREEEPPHYAVRRVTLEASATLPVTFMRVLHNGPMLVKKNAEALRRVLDVIIVADRSHSIGTRPFYDFFQPEMLQFLRIFDEQSDRVAIISFAGNVTPIPSRGTENQLSLPASPGFDRSALEQGIRAMKLAGWTASGPAMYDAYWALANAPSTGLEPRWKVILLFTDGTPNTIHIDPKYFNFKPNCRDNVPRDQPPWPPVREPFCEPQLRCPRAPDPDEMLRDGVHISAGELDHPVEDSKWFIFGLYRHISRPPANQEYDLFREWGYFLKEDGPNPSDDRRVAGSLISSRYEPHYHRSCEDPRHLVGVGGTEPDFRLERPPLPGSEMPLKDFHNVPMTPQLGPPVVSRRVVDFALPPGDRTDRWLALRKKINGMARNHLENVANLARQKEITIFTIGLDGVAGQMERENPEWTRLDGRPERGKDICMRVANVREADTYNDNQPTGLFVEAVDERQIGDAFKRVANAILRLSH